MLIAIVYLSNSTLSNSISNNSTSSGTIIDKADTDEISPDLYFEAKKDETIKEFIDRLGSSIKGEKKRMWSIMYMNVKEAHIKI